MRWKTKTVNYSRRLELWNKWSFCNVYSYRYISYNGSFEAMANPDLKHGMLIK